MSEIFNFNNKLRLINNYMPSTRSVSTGIFVGVGSANENPGNNGISHFTEHMLFKGTTNRNAFEIAEEVDGIGGQINAYTSKQVTSYYTVSTDEHKRTCMDILSDIFFNSVFSPEEIKKEQGVVLEEISMSEDTPDDLCLDMSVAAYYNSHPLAYSILGSRENVSSFDQKILKQYVSDYYNPCNTVISIAGNMKDDEALALTEEFFAKKMSKCKIVPDKLTPADRKQKYLKKFKKIEQSNVAVVFPGLEFNHRLEVAMLLLNSVLGGGMSSLLFQRIREELGLAYSVYSFPSSYTPNGSFTLYFATNKESVVKALEGAKDIINAVKKNGITEKEFNRGKEQLKGGLVLGQESSSAIMNASGKTVIMKNERFDIDARLNAINSITMADIRDIIDIIFDFNKASLSYVGPEIKQDLLKVIND